VQLVLFVVQQAVVGLQDYQVMAVVEQLVDVVEYFATHQWAWVHHNKDMVL
jgi:hypothetical protein